MRPPDVSLPAVLPFPAAPLDPKALERPAARSVAVPWGLVAGLPALGLLVSLAAGLPLFAALMAGCFLLAATLTCRRALATLAGRALRLRLAARLVVVLVLGALLLCASGALRSAVVGTVLFWLTADRLLGRHSRRV